MGGEHCPMSILGETVYFFKKTGLPNIQAPGLKTFQNPGLQKCKKNRSLHSSNLNAMA
jgi:hypothetical protein